VDVMVDGRGVLVVVGEVGFLGRWSGLLGANEIGGSLYGREGWDTWVFQKWVAR